MSMISYLDQFPMEKLSSTLQSFPFSIFVIGLVEFIFFQISMSWVERICKYFSRSLSSIQYQTVKLSDSLKDKVGEKQDHDFRLSTTKACSSEKKDDRALHSEDMEMVMGRLGIFCHPLEDNMIHERLGVEYFSRLFEENEPSLDEVKEAFDVFDLNRDGFIDAIELQRVLCALGLNDRSQIESCKQMIKVFDENKDGRIDFREFVKFMENSFC